jgi:hypothetical protein
MRNHAKTVSALLATLSFLGCAGVKMKDVSDYKAKSPAIQRMVQQGIMEPDSQGNFNPNGTVTRAEFARYLTKTYRLPAPTVKRPLSDVDPSDEDAVQAAYSYLDPHLLCLGCQMGGRFIPKAAITRIEASAAVLKILLERGDIQPLSGDELEDLHRNPALKAVAPAARAFALLAAKNKLPNLRLNGMVPIRRVETAVLLDSVLTSFGAQPKKPAPKRSKGGGGLKLPVSTELTGNDLPFLGGGAQFGGGPVMQNPKVYLIYWHPGLQFDPSAPNDSAYESTMQNLFKNVGGTTWFNIATQYSGLSIQKPSSVLYPVNPPAAPSMLVDTFDDKMNAYPNNPLQDGDIQNEVKAAMLAKGWQPGQENLFVVFLGSGIQVCTNQISCTPDYFCAYHGAFSQSSNDLAKSPVVYAALPQQTSIGGLCWQDVTNPLPGSTLVIDRETVALSHEFMEAVTDPLVTNAPGMVQYPAWGAKNSGNEIGDLCEPPITQASIISLNSVNFQLQQIWDQDDSACVSAYGPSIQFTLANGAPVPKADSTVMGAILDSGANVFQTAVVKPPFYGVQNGGDWTPNWNYGFVFHIESNTPYDISELKLSLISAPGKPSDLWLLDTITTKVFTPTGVQMCGGYQNGTPLAYFNGATPSSNFPMTCCSDTSKPYCASGKGKGQCLAPSNCDCLLNNNCPACPDPSLPQCASGPGKDQCLDPSQCLCLEQGTCSVGEGGSPCEAKWKALGCPLLCPNKKPPFLDEVNCTCSCL